VPRGWPLVPDLGAPDLRAPTLYNHDSNPFDRDLYY
jgi:hypothetical protein